MLRLLTLAFLILSANSFAQEETVSDLEKEAGQLNVLPIDKKIEAERDLNYSVIEMVESKSNKELNEIAVNLAKINNKATEAGNEYIPPLKKTTITTRQQMADYLIKQSMSDPNSPNDGL